MECDQICLILKWFKIDKDALVADENSCISLKKAHSIINADEDDIYIAYNYIVTPDISEELKPYYKHQFDFNNYDYFVCRYSNRKCINGKPVRFDP